MRSIDECIALFNCRNGNEYQAIRQMELLGEWETAAQYWEKLGRMEDANACRLIVESNKAGDEYRASLTPEEEQGKPSFQTFKYSNFQPFRHGKNN